MAHTGDIEALDACLQEAAKKLGELLKHQSTLLRELEAASSEAESNGQLRFATVFRAMAAQIGAPGKGLENPKQQPPSAAAGRQSSLRNNPRKASSNFEPSLVSSVTALNHPAENT